MIIAVIVILGFIILIILLKRYRLARLPEFLRDKNVTRYKDIITDRDVYVASYKDKESKKYITMAYFADDETVCKMAIFKEPYGFMMYENGKLSVVPKGYVIGLLERLGKIKSNRNKNEEISDRESEKADEDSKV